MNPKRNPILIFFFIFIFGIVLVLIVSTPADKETNDDIENKPTELPVTQSDSWIILDSDLVYGPGSLDFSIDEFIHTNNGYLTGYSESVYGNTFSGAEIIQKVSEDYSIDPRLLLAIIEYQSGWVTLPQGNENWKTFPVAENSILGDSLFIQLSRSADLLNLGFYARRVNAFDQVTMIDGTDVYLLDETNSGTAGIYSLFSAFMTQNSWSEAITNGQFANTYISFFGDPMNQLGSIVSSDLVQPTMQLPFENNKIWSFTGGPHPAWGGYSAWAALDFAPPKDELGCVQNDEWVTAVADGQILRSDQGVVVLDLDGDGHEQTGWVVLYLHIETRDRIAAGTDVKAGQVIGHASCEGGISTGTHVHIARKFNGEWIPADQDIPFILDGWVSGGTGIEYNGTLQKQDRVIEALDGRQEENKISR